MVVQARDLSPIPSAPFDDLDLDEDDEEWERRVMVLAAARIAAARARLARLGIIDSEGKSRRADDTRFERSQLQLSPE